MSTIKTQGTNTLGAACAIAALTFADPSFANATFVPSYEFTVSDYPGAPTTLILGLNNRGEAAGYAEGFSNGDEIPFYYNTRSRLYRPITPLTGFDVTEVWNLNDRGTTVGIAHSFDYSVETAFYRDADGNYKLLPHPGYPFSEGQGINDSGKVVGEAWNADFSQNTGFLYDPEKHRFTDFLPSADTEVHGINDRTDIVGEVSLATGAAYPNSPAGSYGFHRAANGEITLFRVNGMDTYARTINNCGTVAGEVFDASGNAKGFVIEADQFKHSHNNPKSFEPITVPLLVVPGQVGTFIQSVTDSGDLAGATMDAQGDIHGFTARRKR